MRLIPASNRPPLGPRLWQTNFALCRATACDEMKKRVLLCRIWRLCCDEQYQDGRRNLLRLTDLTKGGKQDILRLEAFPFLAFRIR
jgi:hypothetical protein